MGDCMAESFIISIKDNKPTEEAHRLFLRFGSGTFEREKVTIRKSKMIDVSAGHDYLGLLQDIFLETFQNEDIEYSGTIIVQNPKEGLKAIEEQGLKVIKSVGKKHTIQGNMKGDELLRAKEAMFAIRAGFLISFAYDKNTLKSKTSYVKPGKTVEGFVKMKIGSVAFNKILERIGLKEFKKKAVIETTYNIDRVVYDDSLLKKDPAKARMESRRDAKITRKVTSDSETITEEIKALV
jgi:hypothetical protein